MTPTKKQIAEVTAAAISNNVNVDAAIRHLTNCSASIFKAIGVAGVIAAVKSSSQIEEGQQAGGVLVSRCSILGQSEKAYLMSIPVGLRTIEKWIAKSIIKKSADGSDYIPFWAIK